MAFLTVWTRPQQAREYQVVFLLGWPFISNTKHTANWLGCEERTPGLSSYNLETNCLIVLCGQGGSRPHSAKAEVAAYVSFAIPAPLRYLQKSTISVGCRWINFSNHHRAIASSLCPACMTATVRQQAGLDTLQQDCLGKVEQRGIHDALCKASRMFSLKMKTRFCEKGKRGIASIDYDGLWAGN